MLPCWLLRPVCGECFLSSGLRSAMLCILLLTGLCSCLHQYHFVNKSMMFHDAQMYCQSQFTDLATIDNTDDMQQLVAAVDSGYEGQVWIGLYDIDWAWDWSLLDLSYYRLGEYMYRVWNSSEPNNPRTQKNLCVSILGGYWFDAFCTETFTFVCYDNPGDPGLQATSTSNYIFINQRMAWADAEAYCRLHYTDLASVRNSTENTLIVQVVPYSEMVWIGLYRLLWMWWSDYSSSQFRNWVSGHPLANTGNCASSVINATLQGQWLENPCETKLNFVCHNKKKQMFLLKVTAVNPSVDLNNPDVLEGIWTYMDMRMRAMGFTKNVIISWKQHPGKNIFHSEEINTGILKL